MMCYRFLRTEHALDLMQTKRWKVGRLLELNDPADCQPNLVGAPEQPDEAAWNNFHQNYLASIYEDIGVLCFSTSISDPVVWSHYADAHRGIALGFDFLPDLGGVSPYQVTYQESRATLDFAEAERLRPEGRTTEAFIEKVVTNGFTKKALSWAYEKEYRIFTHLGGAECQMIGSHYFQRCGAPNEVVLGLRCPIRTADILRMVGRDGVTAQNVRRARSDRNNYSLVIRPA
jgi:hypothetical protein